MSCVTFCRQTGKELGCSTASERAARSDGPSYSRWKAKACSQQLRRSLAELPVTRTGPRSERSPQLCRPCARSSWWLCSVQGPAKLGCRGPWQAGRGVWPGLTTDGTRTLCAQQTVYSNADCNNNLSSATKILDEKLDQRHQSLITYNFPSFQTAEPGAGFSWALCTQQPDVHHVSTDFSAVSGTQLRVCCRGEGWGKVLVTLRCHLALKAGVSGLSQFLLEYCSEVPALITMIHNILMLAIRHCHAVGWVTATSKPALSGRLTHCLPRATEVLSWGLGISGGLSVFVQVCFWLWLGRDLPWAAPSASRYPRLSCGCVERALVGTAELGS